MKKFDLKRRCPKCGSKGATASYHAAWRGSETITASPERMSRVCQTCGHVWSEEPLTLSPSEP